MDVTLAALRAQVKSLKDSAGYNQADSKTKELLGTIDKRLETLNLRLNPPARRQAAQVEMAERSPESEPTEERPQPEAPAVKGVIGQRAALLMNSVESITEVPSRGLQEEINTLSRDLKQVVAEVNAISQRELPAIAAKLGPTGSAAAAPAPKVDARW